MKCPYCVSVIDDEALACPHCARDLYLFKPLLARIQALETALGEAGSRIDTLELGPAAPPSAALPSTVQEEPTSWPAWALLLPALLLLLSAHALIVIALDLPTLWLRLASLLIPLPFGYLLVCGNARSVFINLLLAGAVALLSVIGMSALVALIDGTPVLPANSREWREFAYYAVSILLSFSTGMIVSRLRQRGVSLAQLGKNALLLRLVGTVWGAARDPAKMQKQLEAMRNLLGTITATATAVASLASGLTGVVGG
ncbi:zinc ribbon domain-containing protein [Roseateles oligotrophus]|uniref:Zinc ribbon domain-containing protein n=1 Tax=Roseateles oligotrophus TaxID=1769250 RepID=A0ABT2YB47_9BURK|nr:zinc ribbon domain-containing protein [Roseateles oligotrophus]MCV2367526.1 zinc ribbon domain-containing protein [Roseateles oligotrophus]